MAGKIDQIAHSEAIAKVVAFAPYAPEVREHLNEVLQSPMFQASPRSRNLLKYVVERALDGEFELLKERLLGSVLFGRAPDYDTGEDAIVRVAASDARKRLHHYYEARNLGGGIRIDLPTGSYIPSFAIVPGEVSVMPERSLPETANRAAVGKRVWFAILLAGGILAAAMLFVFRPAPAPRLELPWSALFSGSDVQTHIILSDTNLSALQFALGYRVRLSEYANRRYTPAFEVPMSPEMQRMIQSLNAVDYSATAAIDADMVLRVTQLAEAKAPWLQVRPARAMQLRDFAADNNYILLGSPSSDPWVALFHDHMDFVFDFDKELKTEFIQNKHPRTGEPQRYVPSAFGGATGRTYGIISLLKNPNNSRHVLILAGTTAEATEACMKLVSKPEAFSAMLQRLGIAGSGAVNHFEILLAVDGMAGAPTKAEVIAAHAFPGKRESK